MPIIVDMVKPNPISVADNPILLNMSDVGSATPPAPNAAQILFWLLTLNIGELIPPVFTNLKTILTHHK